MQRTFISSGPRSCLNANGSLPSRCPSDLTPRAFTRSFGKKIFKSQSAALLDPESRDRRLKDAANKALQDKYDRNTYNKRYRERRKEKFDAKKDKEEDKKTREVANIYRQALRQPAKDAMKAMKEDWALGALAPKRDIGDKTGKLGTLDMGLHQLTALTKVQKAEVKQRMGDNEFRVHDRVVVLKGRDRGKIGQILSIDEDKLSATIDGINKVSYCH
jgi:ribosomal protein L14E/L6E/L27E